MFNWSKKKQTNGLFQYVPQKQETKNSFFGTHMESLKAKPDFDGFFKELKKHQPFRKMGTEDSINDRPSIKWQSESLTSIPDVLANWYISQGFINHQFAAILSQHWLINKACFLPSKDAVRNGYEVVSSTETSLNPEAVALFKKYDKTMGIKKHLQNFLGKGRIFGIRIAIFKVNSTDPQYYEKPFNLDGITPRSYKGIIQVDPYWCAPELDINSASRSDTMHFYEPTWWTINGKRYHRSHLVIYRTCELPDILKPQYLYGGIPLPQQIMERVYAAERTANEAPQLVQTKRTNVWLTDLEKFSANAENSIKMLETWAHYRDNYSIKVGDKEGDEFSQFDINLSDLDNVILGQYKLVACIAGIPETKLLCIQPGGFNSTGNYEEAAYHEELESIQENDLTPFLDRHHAILMRSHIAPALGIDPIETCINWMPLDSPTAKELAETNLIKSQTGAQLIQSGAIGSEEERKRISSDGSSGYPHVGMDDIQNLEDDE